MSRKLLPPSTTFVVENVLGVPVQVVGPHAIALNCGPAPALPLIST